MKNRTIRTSMSADDWDAFVQVMQSLKLSMRRDKRFFFALGVLLGYVLWG